MKRTTMMAIAIGAVLIVSIPLIYLAIPRMAAHERAVTVEPVVLVSNKTANPDAFPWTEILEEFAREYGPGDVDKEFLRRLVEIMAGKAEVLGEDPAILTGCIGACYPKGTSGTIDMIPCYAELGRWDGERVWIIAFNVRLGSNMQFQHEEVRYVSITDKTIVYSNGCN